MNLRPAADAASRFSLARFDLGQFQFGGAKLKQIDARHVASDPFLKPAAVECNSASKDFGAILFHAAQGTANSSGGRMIPINEGNWWFGLVSSEQVIKLFSLTQYLRTFARAIDVILEVAVEYCLSHDRMFFFDDQHEAPAAQHQAERHSHAPLAGSAAAWFSLHLF